MRKNMIQNLIVSLAPKNPWNLIWIVLSMAIILTALLNYIQGIIWFGHFSFGLIIVGTINAVIVSLLIAPLAIHLGLIEQQRIKAQLNILALTDELTKLNNRRGFFLLAEQLLSI